MIIDSDAALIQALRQFRLLEAAQVGECANLQGQFPEPRALARELVQRQWLTGYQVNQLFQGRGTELLFGSYVLLDRIGEGGMGVVFKARNWKMDRVVALKVIRKEKLSSPTAIRRFQREVKAAAQLHHPNIVIAFDADVVNDTHFIAMEYVEGTDLWQLVIDSGPASVAHSCEFIRQTALGLQHAYERGLVHRDVKPSNLLVNRRWLESAAAKRNNATVPTASGLGPEIKILDMGLARLHGSADDDRSGALTQEGTVVGSPDFLSPEQARDSHVADVRSDLYSLGCTFYYLLTGKVPFPAETLSNKIWKHNFEEPVPVEQLRPETSPGVAGILRKLMAKKPEDRFQTPAEVATALEMPSQWTLAEAAPARAAPRATVLAPSGPVALANGASAAPTAVLIPASYAIRPGSPAPAAALTRQQRLFVIGGVVALGLAAVVLVAVVAGIWWRSKHRPGGGMAESGGAPLSPAALVAGPGGVGGARAWTLETKGPRGPLTTVAFRPDGRVIASADDLGSIRFWDTRSGELMAILVGSASRPIQRLAFSPDGKQLASGTDDTVNLWDVERRRLVRSLSPGAASAILAWSPNGSLLVCNGPEATLVIYNAASGSVTQRLTGHTQPVRAAVWSRDGSKLASGGVDRIVRVWDPATGKGLQTMPGHTYPIQTLSWSPDGKMLASGSVDRTIRTWDPASGKPIAVMRGHNQHVYALAWSPDSRRLASASADQSVRIWDPATGNQFDKGQRLVSAASGMIWTTDAKPAPAKDGLFEVWEVAPNLFLRVFVSRDPWPHVASPTGNVCARTGDRLQLLEAISGKPIGKIVSHPFGWQPVVAWSPNGKVFVTNNPSAATLHLWDASSGQALRILPGHRFPPSTIAWSPDGTKLASGSADNSVRIWDPAVGNLLDSYPCAERVNAIAWSADGTRLAAGCSDKLTCVWDVKSGRALPPFTGHKAAVVQVAWSPDGTTLASRGAEEAVVHFWRVGTSGPVRTLTGHKNQISSMGWSPDGKSFVTSSHDATVRIWDADSGLSRHVLEGHAAPVFHAAFSPDSKRVASAGGDRSVRLWDVDSGRPLDKFLGHSDVTHGVRWLSTETLAVRAGQEIKVWSTSSGKPVRTVAGVSFSTISPDGKTLVGGFQSGLRFWDLETDRTRGTIVFLGDDQVVVISPVGHYRSIPRNLTELVYVVQTDAGLEMLGPTEFAGKYGWSNRPDEVRLK